MSKLEKKKRNIKNSRRRGAQYEQLIAKELRELGFEGVVTSRAESKSMDDNKIDLVDKNNQLPCYIQLKKTGNTPNYFDIEKACTLKDKPFVII